MTCGMLFKSGFLEVTPEVRSVPLGQKRKRGRPKKLPNCLARSPIRTVCEQSTMVENPSTPTSLSPVTSNKRKSFDEDEDDNLTISCSPVAALRVGLGGSKPPKKRAKVTAPASPHRPPPVKCKKRKGSCNHVVAFNQHYNKVLWDEYANYLKSKKATTAIDPNYV